MSDLERTLLTALREIARIGSYNASDGPGIMLNIARAAIAVAEERAAS